MSPGGAVNSEREAGAAAGSQDAAKAAAEAGSGHQEAAYGLVARLTGWSIERRGWVAALLVLSIGAGAVVASQLKFDALPDITNNQVLVLTRSPGLSPEEVERLVTRPIEVALGGCPGLIEQRSISRFGISSVTAIFDEDVPPMLARQVAQERLIGLGLPSGVEAPALGPLTGGLGEIFHVALTSARRTPRELLELAQYKVAPLLRTVRGVVEVNTWGGQERVLEVRVDPLRLAARGLTLGEVARALQDSMGAVAGTALPAGSGQALLRGLWRPLSESELGGVLVGRETLAMAPLPDPASRREVVRPVRAADVAQVHEGAVPRLGAASRNGQGETVYLMAQMLRGDNALQVMEGLQGRMPAVRALLPPDVKVELVYDRSVLVYGTLRTVGRNLLEGGLLVAVVLLLLLGSWRAGLLVATAIPLSMLGAAVGMVLLGVPGNLMSLGALDFGLLVDGSVVMVEHLFHRLRPWEVTDAGAAGWRTAMQRAAQEVARPVLFSVLIILLVYVPVLSLGGVEGKMFRPMALTVVLALVTSLVLALTVMPAAASLLLRPADVAAVQQRAPLLFRVAARLYAPLLREATARPLLVAGLSVALLGLGGVLFARAGSEFVPQLDEGDLVIQTTRAPDIALTAAVREAGRMEAALLAGVPEVAQVVSRVGSPAVATDIMGLEQADVFLAMRPRNKWRPGLSREALIAQMEQVLREHAPGAEPSFTQPIQMRFNEILAGAVSDVVVSIYGDDLGELRRLAEQLGAVCRREPGVKDLKILAPPDLTLLDVRPRPLEAAQAGLSVREVLDAVQALRTGLPVGVTFDGPVRVPVILRLGLQLPSAFTLADQQLPTPGGGVVTLGRVAEVRSHLAPSLIQRHNGERRLLLGFNVREADLGTAVAGAQRRIASEVKLPPGYRLEWGGQYETLEDAQKRLRVLIPVMLLLIVLLLWFLFQRLRPAVILFSHVPFACTGGMIALWLRGMPMSISAAIGFIALSGIAVLNGVVLMATLRQLEVAGLSAAAAANKAAQTRLRPVLMTALVAALGFVPMMLAHGVGAEVQRPLATVVVGGLGTSTLLTLVILPSLYPFLAGLGCARPKTA